ncbi:MAG: HAMP domain-containing sensor histidine kinase [Planctomycetota bacterium]|nr:HAMP domain-containing sensor histidine kinase [Planctomycetota bacterium]MDI6788463.1 HAMP domain-containing sensor histidine kinase [Planctomycetota bacterium]
MHNLERRQWGLWLCVFIILFIYALCILAVVQPRIWHEVFKDAARPTFTVLFVGLFILTVLLCIYVIYSQITIMRLSKAIRADEQLKLLGSLTSRISHELKNDLAIALGYTELLLQEDFSEDTRTQLLNIQTRLKEMAGFLHDTLVLSRKRVLPPFILIDLTDLIRGLLAEYKNESIKNKIIVREELPLAPVEVYGGRHELSEVFMNLYKNAVESMQETERKYLNIRLEQTANKCLVHISDTGEGIKPEILNDIFKPFVTTKPLGKGTGMGLHIAKTIIYLHKGQIYAKNNPQEKGGGVTFTVELPLAINSSRGELNNDNR